MARAAAARSAPHSSRSATPARKAPARRKPPAKHAARRRPASQPRSSARRRASGPAAGAPAVALPVRVFNAPFARAARRRTSGMLDALLSGRGWIALVFVLLAGIVFFNVDLLQMNREIARNADRAAAIKTENARLRADLARLGSSERIQQVAAQAGLVLPAPGDVRYLRTAPAADARRAAKRIDQAKQPQPVEP